MVAISPPLTKTNDFTRVFGTFEFITGPKAEMTNFWLVFRFFLNKKQLPPPGEGWVVVGGGGVAGGVAGDR